MVALLDWPTQYGSIVYISSHYTSGEKHLTILCSLSVVINYCRLLFIQTYLDSGVTRGVDICRLPYACLVYFGPRVPGSSGPRSLGPLFIVSQWK